MTNVKIQKIPMKDLSPKELAELAFDMGVTRGGSRTANTLKRGGLKRGAYGQGVGKYKDGGKVKEPKTPPKPKTLPKPKPKIGDLNEMGPIYTDTKTGKKVKRMEDGGALSQTLEITPEMLELIREMKKSGKNFRPKKIEPFTPPTESQKKVARKFAPTYFKDGGAAFPDLTGDGKVTKKDILKGRGVEGFEHGGEVRGMGRAYMGPSRKAKIR